MTLLEQRQHDRASVPSRRPELLRPRLEPIDRDETLDDRGVEHILEAGEGRRPPMSISVRTGGGRRDAVDRGDVTEARQEWS